MMSMIKIFAVFSATLWSACCAFHQEFLPHPPATVSSLTPSAFEGRWYQMYASFFPNVTFERNAFCIVSDYAATNSGTNNVTFAFMNSENKGSPKGTLHQMAGMLYNPFFEKFPGKFFYTLEETRIIGTYWILALGDIGNSTKVYPWAVTSNALGSEVFILARDIDVFRSTYEEDVLKVVSEAGFNFYFNKPLETFQSTTECVYPPIPAVPSGMKNGVDGTNL